MSQLPADQIFAEVIASYPPPPNVTETTPLIEQMTALFSRMSLLEGNGLSPYAGTTKKLMREMKTCFDRLHQSAHPAEKYFAKIIFIVFFKLDPKEFVEHLYDMHPELMEKLLSERGVHFL